MTAVVDISSQGISPRGDCARFRVMGIFDAGHSDQALRLWNRLNRLLPSVTHLLIPREVWCCIPRSRAQLEDKDFQNAQTDRVLTSWQNYLKWESGSLTDDGFPHGLRLTSPDFVGEMVATRPKDTPQTRLKKTDRKKLRTHRFAVVAMVPDFSPPLQPKTTHAPPTSHEEEDEVDKDADGQPLFCVLEGFRKATDAKEWIRRYGQHRITDHHLFVVPVMGSRWIRPIEGVVCVQQLHQCHRLDQEWRDPDHQLLMKHYRKTISPESQFQSLSVRTHIDSSLGELSSTLENPVFNHPLKRPDSPSSSSSSSPSSPSSSTTSSASSENGGML